MGKPLELDEASFESRIAHHRGTAVVDFWAPWCGRCRAAAPAVARLAGERSDVLVAKVNVDRAPVLAARYGISTIPTIVRFEDGTPVATAIGALPYDRLLATLRLQPLPRAA